MRPIERRAQSSLPLGTTFARPRKQFDPLGQSGGNFLRGQDREACGDQLQRQRNTVETAADGGDDGGVGIAQREASGRRLNAPDQQLDRREAQRRRRVGARSVGAVSAGMRMTARWLRRAARLVTRFARRPASSSAQARSATGVNRCSALSRTTARASPKCRTAISVGERPPSSATPIAPAAFRHGTPSLSRSRRRTRRRPGSPAAACGPPRSRGGFCHAARPREGDEALASQVARQGVEVVAARSADRSRPAIVRRRRRRHAGRDRHGTVGAGAPVGTHPIAGGGHLDYQPVAAAFAAVVFAQLLAQSPSLFANDQIEARVEIRSALPEIEAESV